VGDGVAIPIEAVVALRRRLAALPIRHPERLVLMDSVAKLYAVSRATLYRLLRGDRRPKDAHRADRGKPRTMPAAEIERWCEIVAALKVRTTNKKGRCLSNARILELLVEHGVETPDGLEKLLPGRLSESTLNRHLRRLGYDRDRMTREPPCPSGKTAKHPEQGRRKPPAIKYLHFQLTFHAQIGYGAAHAHAPEGPTPADFRRRSRLHPPVDRRSSGVESQDRVEAGV
jgi:predicted DNA-binding transcriptional regulator AlpA